MGFIGRLVLAAGREEDEGYCAVGVGCLLWEEPVVIIPGRVGVLYCPLEVVCLS